MIINYPAEPSGNYQELIFSIPKTFIINNHSYPPTHCLLFFYIRNGKYINGYDINGTRLYSLLISNRISSLSITNNVITLNF